MLNIADLAAALPNAPVLAWSVGWQEIVVIVIVVLILFGGKKIPELAKGLGRGLREFKKEIGGVKRDFEEASAAAEEDDDYEAPRPPKRRKKPRPAPEVANTAEGTDAGEMAAQGVDTSADAAPQGDSDKA